jgi:hypothetical protein
MEKKWVIVGRAGVKRSAATEGYETSKSKIRREGSFLATIHLSKF